MKSEELIRKILDELSFLYFTFSLKITIDFFYLQND